MKAKGVKVIKLPTALLAKVASAAGMSQEEYIAYSRSISCGFEVCAHFENTEGELSVFSLARSVRTLWAGNKQPPKTRKEQPR